MNTVWVLPAVERLRVAFVGYGEVGGILARALVLRGVAAVWAYDVRLDAADGGTELRRRAERDGVLLQPTAGAAVAGAHLVVSAVTASNTRAAVDSVAPSLEPGAYLLDVNSASPRTKAACGARIAADGGRYVESAVMTAVPPYGIKVPMLLGGPHAAGLAPLLGELGFAAKVASDTFGVASAIKMCRSVVIKGMEALLIESFVTARRYGVEDEVLGSLAETFPGLDWQRNGDYFFNRVIEHGKRRAEEMREAAATVREAGLTPYMASAIAERQQWMADLAGAAAFAGLAEDAHWYDAADRIPAANPAAATTQGTPSDDLAA